MWRPTKSIATIILIVIIFAFGCSQDKVPEATVGTGEELADEVFTDFVTQESDSGRAQWRLTAPKARRFTKKKLVVLEKPIIEFYGDDGLTRTTLVSNAGEYSEETRDMLAFGDVVVRSTGGDVLETDSLLWNNQRDKILSDSFVRLTRELDGSVVTGYGLECEPDLSRVDIKRNMKATFIGEDAGRDE